ncbi:MAG: hypothetical protein K6A35_09870 [bacterium]|jgi:hypothetical protein|nr:hypothetical protein [bacterium]
MRKFSLYLAVLAVVLGMLAVSRPALSQIILMAGEYQVVIVDKAEQRLGIASLDANPDRCQNWIYIKYNTEIFHRVWLDDKDFKVERMEWDEFLATVKKGTHIRVHGGRDWDGSIDARKIWF